MKVSIKVDGVEDVVKRLLGHLRDSGRSRDPSVEVGYDTPYALYVHENLQAHHPVGQAKFLEQPARQNLGLLTKTVANQVESSYSFAEGLFEAGKVLLRLSLPLVPVDTGLLKSTGQVRYGP